MDDSERIPDPTPSSAPPAPPKAIKGGGTHRTQRLATALRDNLKRRKAAARAIPARPSN